MDAATRSRFIAGHPLVPPRHFYKRRYSGVRFRRSVTPKNVRSMPSRASAIALSLGLLLFQD
jgi:hypothetical protein